MTIFGDLWVGDDQMPSCDRCMDGRHSECLDIIYTDPYGAHACGCTNKEHDRC